MAFFLVSAVALAFFLLSSPRAEAGVISFISELIGFGSSAPSPAQNSQTMPLLKAALNTDVNAGKGGGEITIIAQSALLPESGPLGTIADVPVSREHDAISLYVVRSGDTLSEIAEMFDISVNTIRWANDLKRGASLSVGQTLVILPVSGLRYTVKRGDTLASIAKEFKADGEEIMQFNDLTDMGGVKAGDVLIVPNGEVAPAVIPTRAAARLTPSGPTYVGYYLRPIDGGYRSQGLHGHNGVDLANACGIPILAAATGSIVIARTLGWNAGYGNYVVINHPNGTQTLYAHLQKVIVRSGIEVVQGQVIGYMGSTGKSTGCHLHFEVRGARNPF